MISIAEKNNRLYVKMPFELKDDFRKAFPGPISTWHSIEKAWSVDPGKKADVIEWAESAYDMAASIAADMTWLALLTGELQDEKAAKERAEKSMATLRALRDEIAAAEAERAFERKEREEKEGEIEEALGKLIDRKAVAQAAADMARYEASTSAADTTAWKSAQDIIIASKNNLLNAGIRLEALDFLADLRHGRASVRGMPTGAWHSLQKFAR